ncbi:MAG: CHAT domain-containing protein, partial [Planktothrix sp.]
MDEQKALAYLPLIQELLDCPSGEEPQILNRHLEFLDEGFVQACELVAAQFQEEGQDNLAQFVRNVAQFVRKYLNSLTSEDKVEFSGFLDHTIPEDYFSFLIDVLKAISNTHKDPFLIHFLLQAHQDKLNSTFSLALRQWSSVTFVIVEPQTLYSLATTLVDFSNLIKNKPIGIKANNLEIAITGYEVALTVLKRNTYPEGWAKTLYNLALTCFFLPGIDRIDNQEKGIAILESILEVYTRTEFPQEWALVQTSLGVFYRNRIKGNTEVNQEKAIGFYQSSLEVLDLAPHSEDWARTQFNLGNAYRDRSKGDRAENKELAIAAYESALQFYTKDSNLQMWGGLQINLSIA